MTIHEAFKHLTKQKLWYKPLKLHRNTAASLKVRGLAGELTEDKMREVLKASGYTEIPAKWHKKK